MDTEMATTDYKAAEERKEIDDSIIYAKRIQDGMMLKENHLNRIFPESFIYLKPRNIVSGDFYWFTKVNHKIIIAVADCTGHGVPGALMSILGIALLNQIVIEEKNTDPSFILQRLDHKVHKAFSYTENLLVEHDIENPNDGMDIGLCCIDTQANTLQFAGAYRPVYYVRDGKLSELKGSRYPIGGIQLDNEKSFSNQQFDLKKDDQVYLFSDGYISQFGGTGDKKFSSKRLKELLSAISNFSFFNQKIELERVFNEWKLKGEQTDDVLVMGFKIGDNTINPIESL